MTIVISVNPAVTVRQEHVGILSVPYADLGPEPTVATVLAKAKIPVPNEGGIFIDTRPAALESIVGPGQEVYVAGKQGGA